MNLHSYRTIGGRYHALAADKCLGHTIRGGGHGETAQAAEANARIKLAEEREAVLQGWIPIEH